MLVIGLLCCCAACEELGSLRGGFSLWHSEGRIHHEHYDCKELVLALACSRRWKCSQSLALPPSFIQVLVGKMLFFEGIETTSDSIID